MHVIGWNSAKWLRALTDRISMWALLIRQQPTFLPGFSWAPGATPSTFSCFGRWVGAAGDNHKQMRSHRCSWEFSVPGRHNHCSSMGAEAATPQGEILQGQTLLPVPPLESEVVASAVEHLPQEEQAGGQQGSVFTAWPTGEEQSRRTTEKSWNKGNTATHSLPCWGQPSRSGNATFGASRCSHVPPDSTYVTLCIPYSKQPLNSPFNSFFPKAAQFPFFQVIKNNVTSLSHRCCYMTSADKTLQ